MPFCPECEYEYREGIVTCPDCNVTLVNSLSDPVEPTAEETNEKMVSIYSTDSKVEADLIKGMLQASGIEVFDQPDMSFYGNFADTLANLQIYVLEADVAQATILINESQDPKNTHFEY
jgi:hypothetical protein